MCILCLCACSPESSENAGQQNRNEKIWQQSEETNRLLDVANEQYIRVDEQLDKTEEQLNRQTANLKRWEAILERHERVLDRMEDQYGVIR